MGRRAWQATVHGVTESGTTEQLTLSLSLLNEENFKMTKSLGGLMKERS